MEIYSSTEQTKHCHINWLNVSGIIYRVDVNISAVSMFGVRLPQLVNKCLYVAFLLGLI